MKLILLKCSKSVNLFLIFLGTLHNFSNKNQVFLFLCLKILYIFLQKSSFPISLQYLDLKYHRSHSVNSDSCWNCPMPSTIRDIGLSLCKKKNRPCSTGNFTFPQAVTASLPSCFLFLFPHSIVIDRFIECFFPALVVVRPVAEEPHGFGCDCLRGHVV